MMVLPLEFFIFKTLVYLRIGAGHWRYRIGNYRVIVQIVDDELVIATLEVGHRRDIY